MSKHSSCIDPLEEFANFVRELKNNKKDPKFVQRLFNEWYEKSVRLAIEHFWSNLNQNGIKINPETSGYLNEMTKNEKIIHILLETNPDDPEEYITLTRYDSRDINVWHVISLPQPKGCNSPEGCSHEKLESMMENTIKSWKSFNSAKKEEIRKVTVKKGKNLIIRAWKL